MTPQFARFNFNCHHVDLCAQCEIPIITPTEFCILFVIGPELGDKNQGWPGSGIRRQKLVKSAYSWLLDRLVVGSNPDRVIPRALPMVSAYSCSATNGECAEIRALLIRMRTESALAMARRRKRVNFVVGSVVKGLRAI